jgi:hypothetical protein
MKTKFFLFHILVLCVVFGIPANLWADDAGTQVSKIRVLEPGEAERCANNFFVDNIGNEPADLKVVLGDKVFIDKILQPGEKRAFNLPATINVARFQGREDLTFDDVAVIINLGPKSHMRVRCIKLRDNPLRGKDPLATFK